MDVLTNQWPESISKELNSLATFLAQGRLGLMVGAGFSKNANNPKNVDIPDWDGIKNALIQALYPSSSVVDKDVLTLAEEYINSNDSDTFDDFIRKTIPDDELFPSSLHQRLLKLPWKDVFTTNYDTLLERASEKLIATKYSIITHQEQVCDTTNIPRIIKLHGSFQDKTPFIMSAEHYRKYENDYPVFTSTIRQSLIERALCLVGFSGKDPNFQKWIGWIRDIRDKVNKTNPIFLIECRNIPEPELNSMRNKNMIVINLAKCEELKGNFREALEQFISFCEDSCEASSKFIKWPISDDSIMGPQGNSIERILDVWRNERINYPNWFILPQNKRLRLWQYTERHIASFDKDALSFPQDLDYAYELIWRLDKCLMPIYNNNVFINLLDVVKRYNPFNGRNSYTEAVYFQQKNSDMIDWESIKTKWIEIIFILSRQARLEYNADILNFLLNDLLNADIVSDIPEWEARWYYERGLWALGNFDIKNIKRVLAEWPCHEGLFYESLWKSSLFCELGENERAEELLEKTIISIRRLVIAPDNNKSNYLYKDTENHILGFLNLLKQLQCYPNFSDSVDLEKQQEELSLRFIGFQEWLDEANNRWDKLKIYGCDYRDECSFFKDNLEKIPSSGFVTPIKKQDFFSGATKITNNIRCGLGDGHIAVFSLPVFMEQAGCPYRVGFITAHGEKTVINAATWLYQQIWQRYSILMVIRHGDKSEFINNVLTREEIIRYPVEMATNIIKQFAPILTRFVDIAANVNMTESNLASKACKVLPFVIGRLASICSSITLKDIFLLAKQFYSYSHTRRFCLKDETDILWEGVFANRRWSELEDIFLDVLRLPAPQEEGFCSNDPILYITPKCNLTENKHLLLSTKIAPEIDRLLTEAEAMPNKILITRLMHLNFLTLLIANQKLRLAKILWSDSNLGKNGLPMSISRKSWLLSLPRLNENDEYKIKKYLLTLSPPFRNMKLSGVELKENINTISITGGLGILFFDELFFACKEDKFIKKDKYLVLTEQDAIGVYNKILEWWSADKQSVIDNFGKNPESPLGSVEDEIRQRFYNIPEMLSEVIIPALGKNISPQMQQQIINIVEDLWKIEIPCSCVHLALLPNNPKSASSTRNIILEELATGKLYNIQAAHRSIVKWLDMRKLGFVTSDFPKELMDAWENSLMLGMKSHFDYWLMHVIDNRLYKVDIYKISLFLDNMLTQVNKQNVDELSKDPLSDIEFASRLAFSVYRYCKESGEDVPDAANKWEEFASKIALPSVRNVWAE